MLSILVYKLLCVRCDAIGIILSTIYDDSAPLCPEALFDQDQPKQLEGTYDESRNKVTTSESNSI